MNHHFYKIRNDQKDNQFSENVSVLYPPAASQQLPTLDNSGRTAATTAMVWFTGKLFQHNNWTLQLLSVMEFASYIHSTWWSTLLVIINEGKVSPDSNLYRMTISPSPQAVMCDTWAVMLPGLGGVWSLIGWLGCQELARIGAPCLHNISTLALHEL